MQVNVSSEYELGEIAKQMATIAQRGDVLLLEGTLGVGKTSFARAFIRHIGCNPNLVVPSPTFNIVQVYEKINPNIYHFDLYRIENSLELDEIGLEEAIINGVSLIEWPCRLHGYLINNSIVIKIINRGLYSRTVEISAPKEYIDKIKVLI